MIQLAYVGGLGLMAGPATHLKPDGSTYSRARPRQTWGKAERCRASWKAHGAELVRTFEALIGDGKLDGVVVCAGKNGDDVRIIAELARLLQRAVTRSFIMHMSTVSAGFTSPRMPLCATGDWVR